MLRAAVYLLAWLALALRFDRSRPGPNLDTQLPAVVLWASRFPLQHGCLGVYRSLGRAGVPVYAVIGDPHAPVAKSRYVRGTLLWQPHLGEGYPELIERLIDFGRRLGRRSLIVCTSDEMAVLVARHRADLTEHFILPDVDPELPAELADKRGLDTLGRRHGMATPAAVAVDTMTQLIALDAEMTPPLIVKSVALRGQVQSVENTTLVQTREDLLAMADAWTEPFGVVLQEYLPDEDCEDWFTHGYCDAHSRAQVVFTGRKVRTWPARGGATAAAYTAANPTLAELARTFCAAVGYRGVFDIDWRYDRRTGRYNLLDFNPGSAPSSGSSRTTPGSMSCGRCTSTCPADPSPTDIRSTASDSSSNLGTWPVCSPPAPTRSTGWAVRVAPGPRGSPSTIPGRCSPPRQRRSGTPSAPGCGVLDNLMRVDIKRRLTYFSTRIE